MGGGLIVRGLLSHRFIDRGGHVHRVYKWGSRSLVMVLPKQVMRQRNCPEPTGKKKRALTDNGLSQYQF